MFAKTYGAATLGVNGVLIDAEVDVSNGFPGFDVVGLLDTAVKESKERVRTAIKNSGVTLRQQKVTINLAPADIRKDSPGLDLPIAVGLLIAYGVLPQEAAEGSLFAAELSLEGELRGVRGILPMAVHAREMGISRFFVARENANEALLVDGIEVYAVTNLAELIAVLSGRKQIAPAKASGDSPQEAAFGAEDFSDVEGQFFAKRAMEIAAAGGHNVLLAGVPGAGKTMLARRLPTILPAMTREEALEVTKIYSIAGLLHQGGGLMTERPFRSPHHTTSAAALIGGGSVPRPGEVTLSHNGVLFLGAGERDADVPRSYPSCCGHESLPLRVERGQPSRLHMHAVRDQEIYEADIRSAPGPDRSAYSDAAGGIQGPVFRQKGRAFRCNPRAGDGGERTSDGAAPRISDLLQRADEPRDAGNDVPDVPRGENSAGSGVQEDGPFGAFLRPHHKSGPDNRRPRRFGRASGAACGGGDTASERYRSGTELTEG